MASDDFKDTITKMSELEGLTEGINELIQTMNNNKQDYKTKVEGIKESVNKLSAKLVDIKNNNLKLTDDLEKANERFSKGSEENNVLLSDAYTKYQENFSNILEQLKTSVNLTELEGQLEELQTQVNGLLNDEPNSNKPYTIEGIVTTTDVQDANSPPPPPPTTLQNGGYTYGNTKRKGKGRRRRTKKSRKKGSNIKKK